MALSTTTRKNISAGRRKLKRSSMPKLPEHLLLKRLTTFNLENKRRLTD
jgi:hypothetical protein